MENKKTAQDARLSPVGARRSRGLPKIGDGSGAAQLIASAADRIYRKRLAVVPMVIVETSRATICALQLLRMSKQTALDSLVNKIPSAPPIGGNGVGTRVAVRRGVVMW